MEHILANDMLLENTQLHASIQVSLLHLCIFYLDV